MPVSAKQMAAILALPPPQRSDHFIRKVVGWRKLWGLYEDGWAMSETAAGEPVFPLWPEKEYAELCAQAEWAGYEAKEIDLDEFLTDLLPMLEERGVHPGVFYIPEQGSIDATVEQLRRDLQQELEKYAS
jgi:hypothetical protein